MSKTLDDILGTSDTNVPETLADVVASDEAQPAVEHDADIPANTKNSKKGSSVVEVEDDALPATEVTDEADDATIEVAAVESEVKVDNQSDTGQDNVPEHEEFHSYLKSIIRPVVLYGNKYCTKPQGRFSGTVKVIEPPENGVALVEYVIITNGARRKMKAYIHI